MNKKQEKIDIMEAFKKYAKKELEFVEKSDPNKLYHRILPDIKNKDRGSIDFLYKKIKVGGFIEKDTIYLNKLKVFEGGNEDDIDLVIKKIEEKVNEGDMKLVNQLN